MAMCLFFRPKVNKVLWEIDGDASVDSCASPTVYNTTRLIRVLTPNSSMYRPFSIDGESYSSSPTILGTGSLKYAIKCSDSPMNESPRRGRHSQIVGIQGCLKTKQ